MKASISGAEWKVMEQLWQSPHTLKSIVNVLAPAEQWSKSTIITLVRRLEAKQMVRHEQNGRTKTFFAAVDRNQVVAEQTVSFLQRAYHGSVGCLVSGMVEHNNLTKQDIDELYAILREAEETLK